MRTLRLTYRRRSLATRYGDISHTRATNESRRSRQQQQKNERKSRRKVLNIESVEPVVPPQVFVLTGTRAQ